MKYGRGLTARFHEKVDARLENECWNWLGAKDSRGYGFIKEDGHNGRQLHAHRVSYQIHYGVDPKDNYVCHKCDNPSCVNPYHLFLGTPKDNATDMIIKGRKFIPAGEKSYNAKLTDSKVIKIRALYKTGKFTLSNLGKMFSVTFGTISKIVNNQRWKHLGE